jgi:hypothetical protein
MVVDGTLHEIARCTARQAVLQAILPLGAVEAVDAHEPIQRAVATVGARHADKHHVLLVVVQALRDAATRILRVERTPLVLDVSHTRPGRTGLACCVSDLFPRRWLRDGRTGAREGSCLAGTRRQFR